MILLMSLRSWSNCCGTSWASVILKYTYQETVHRQCDVSAVNHQWQLSFCKTSIWSSFISVSNCPKRESAELALLRKSQANWEICCWKCIVSPLSRSQKATTIWHRFNSCRWSLRVDSKLPVTLFMSAKECNSGKTLPMEQYPENLNGNVQKAVWLHRKARTYFLS